METANHTDIYKHKQKPTNIPLKKKKNQQQKINRLKRLLPSTAKKFAANARWVCRAYKNDAVLESKTYDSHLSS